MTIHFTGGDSASMASEFGSEWAFSEQIGDCLGSRLLNATEHSFSAGAVRVVVIGTDCLSLNDTQLNRAFDALQKRDVVLGPAVDGGYYLIGLNHNQPIIFDRIDWGSERVLAQTKAIAKQSGKRIFELKRLSDIDFPENVIPLRCKDRSHESAIFETKPGRVSIVIPTLNEAQQLPETLQSLGPPSEQLEIIVVDGGSIDATFAIANEHGCKVFVGNRGRSHQMNAGAAASTGETLLFLHADTQLPSGYLNCIHDCMTDGNIAGAFRLGIAGENLGLRFVEWSANLRSSLLQLPYGDQAIFLRASTFFELANATKGRVG